ncbi:MAG: ABC transporter ATP-binding protein [Candidatus Nanopelagicales bacterium]
MTVGGRGAGPVPRDDAALRVEDVDKSFGSTPVLAAVTLGVPRGRIVSVLGPSGCGKTTLVRLVAGFESPDSGSITLAGRTVARPGLHVPPESRRVGIVPQEGALFSHLDVAANIGFGLPRGGRSESGRSRVDHMLELVGLTGLGSRRPDQLSGGQQQRVAVARALAPRPEVVCLDEPFSALDAGLRNSVREAVIGALRAEAATVVLVTHDQDEALSVSDTLAVLINGRIAQVGTPAEVYSRPTTSAVARFIGDAVLLPGHATGHHAACKLGLLELVHATQGPTTVLVRPEQIRLSPQGDGGSPGTEARVGSVEYHGHDALVRLVTTAGLAITARVGAGWIPRPGDFVDVEVTGASWPLPAG